MLNAEELVLAAIQRGEDEREQQLADVLRDYRRMGLMPEPDGQLVWEDVPGREKMKWLQLARAVLVATDRLDYKNQRLAMRIVDEVISGVEGKPFTESLAGIEYDRPVLIANVAVLLREVTG